MVKKDSLRNDIGDKDFSKAIEAVAKAWDNEQAWDRLNDLTTTAAHADEVSSLFKKALEVRHSKEVLNRVAKRAVAFYEEWFGDDPAAMEEVLSKVFEIDPAVEWAFERLTASMISTGRWDDLFNVYDGVLSTEMGIERRKRLLDEASNTAKDIADKPEKALQYLMKLQELDRANLQRARLIERMLERQEMWSELIELWRGQIPLMKDDEAKTTWIQIADCYIRRLDDLKSAFQVLKDLLGDNPGYAPACEQLEIILKQEMTEEILRIDVLNLLNDNYDAAGKKEEAVLAIETALDLVTSETGAKLHRRAGNRLALMNRDEEAIRHFASLLLLKPGDADALKNLRILSVRAKRLDLRAEALVAAAEASEDEALKITHLMDAARIYADDLEKPEAAIRVFESILKIENLDPGTALSVSHRLNDLFAAAGRKEERLRVLEQIAVLERTHVLKRTVLVEAARLAEDLDDTQRAMVLWSSLLKMSPDDMEGMSAVIDLMDRTENYPELARALERRAMGPVLPEQRRQDLLRCARIHEEHLDDLDEAITLWKTIFKEFGPRADVVEALDGLLARTDQFEDLDRLLQLAVDGDSERMEALFLRLSDINLTQLNNPKRAYEFLRKVLMFHPSSETALYGMKELISVKTIAPLAVETLVGAHRATDNWGALLEITEQRLDTAENTKAQVAVYLEAAKIQETRAKNPEAARDLLTRAVPLDPTNQALEEDMMRLAMAHGGWNRTGLALRHAAAALDEKSLRRAHLKRLEGRVLEQELKKEEAALEAYLEVIAIDERNVQVIDSVVRVATRLGQWEAAADAVLSLAVIRSEIDSTHLDALQKAAEERDQMSTMVETLITALDNRAHLRVEIRRDMEIRVANFYRDFCEDITKAESVAKRAVATGPKHLDALVLLADIQREAESPELIGTLESIYDLDDSSLDPLQEAAQIAIDRDLLYSEKRRHLLNLYEAAATTWRLGKSVTGDHSPRRAAHFAAWHIAEIDAGTGAWQKAAELLLASAELPFEVNEAREMRRKAASLFAENGMRSTAISVFQKVLKTRGDDVETLKDMESLLEVEHRISELLDVKQRLLDLVEDEPTKLTLRLDVARLAGILEGAGTRIDVLKANLAVSPGHPDSIAALSELMRERGFLSELAELLESQSRQVADAGNAEQAASLLIDAAKIAEENLQDIPRAMADYEGVVDLIEDPFSMDALARLNSSRNQLRRTVSWLQRRLTVAKPHERVSVLLRLARSQLKTDQVDDATSTLEQAFEEAPRNAEIRKLLLERYREMETYDALAAALSRAAGVLSDPGVVVAYAEEAADVYFYKLNVVRRAVSVLERAVTLAPEEHRFRVMLAEALVADEQYERAEALLGDILEGYGRRRSPERAAVHLQLAKVEQARGDLDGAVEQLELAATMDSHNMAIVKTLAELLRDKGDLEKSDKTYRSLLLLVRREAPKEGEISIVSPSEILFELSFIARDWEQLDKAAELEESAFEALSADDAEVRRLKERLEERGDFSLLVKVYENLLSYVDMPKQRAQVLSWLAEALDTHLEQTEKALEIQFQALESDPASPEVHDAAETLSNKLGRYDEYIAKLGTLIQKTRREDDVLKRCELLLRLVQVHVKRDELDRAWEMYEQAQAIGVREVDVLRTGVKLSQARGDEQAQVRMLSALSQMGEQEIETETRADAMFRLAEIYLASEETFEEGISTFEEAFNEAPRCLRAGRILVRTCNRTNLNDRLMRIFERVARKSNDDNLLLEFLERKATLPDAAPSEIREGVELAFRLEEAARAEALMTRMVEVEEQKPEDKIAITWAVLTLSSRRRATGDLQEAFDWLKRAGEIADQKELFEHGLEIAPLASEGGDSDLAIDVYKWLLEFDPSAQAAWHPLARLYYDLKEEDGFEALVQETLYTIEDPSARNELRLLWAKLLMTTEDRKEEALEVLKNIQLDEPDHAESLAMIAAYYETSGRHDELVEFLEFRFEEAKEKDNTNELKTLALQLGSKLRANDPARAESVYRTALAELSEDRELLSALLATLKGEEHAAERAALKERMLMSESDETVAEIALLLVDELHELEDKDAIHRVLRYAYSRVPDNDSLRDALEQSYRDREDYRGLIDMLLEGAKAIASPEDRAKEFLKLAEVAREQLHDLSREIEALRQANAACPDDLEILMLLLEGFANANRHEEAINTASASLEATESKEARARLLNFRGDLLRISGGLPQALADLEEAFDLQPETAVENLIRTLYIICDEARREGDLKAERGHILRLIEVLSYAERPDEIRSLLAGWLERDESDVNAWKMVLKIETDSENWSSVIEICQRLIDLTEGEEQIKTAVWLRKACELSDQLEVAQVVIQSIYEQHPENAALRADLQGIYEKTGAERELAAMLLEDAAAATSDSARADLLKRAGKSFYNLGEPDAALAAFQEAVTLAPEDFETTLAVVDLYLDREALEEANELIDQAIDVQGGRRSPELSLLQYRKAMIFRAYGDQSGELSWLEQAFVSNRANEEIVCELADIAEELEEWDLALKALKQISFLKTECRITKAESFYRQGRIAYYQEEDRKRAILYIRKALQEDGDYEEAKSLLEEINE